MNETSIGTKKIYIAGAGGIILLIAAVLGYYGYRHRGIVEQGSPKPTEAQKQKEEGKDASSIAPAIVAIEGSGNYTVESLPLSDTASREGMPLLRRPIVFSSVFSPEAQRLMTQKIEASIAALEKNPQLFDEWMQLAILRKTVDDYEGARQIWEFLKTTNPQQPGPYANLAALYTYELKNPDLAERNFAQAIQKGPNEVSVWRNGYDFYRYVRKDDGKAKETLQAGIAQTKSTDLQYLLDHYNEL